MSILLQAEAILAVRAEIDDAIDGKVVFDYSPLLGIQDGLNTLFAIPQSRIVVQNLQVFKNRILLVLGTNYTVPSAQFGKIQFTVAPQLTDEIAVTFSYTWATDIEIDHHLNRAANELGYGTYHTNAATVSGSESATPISDFPDGLKAALIYLGAYRIANSLASRLALKYDISAGDHSYSPSQMAEKYNEIAERMQTQGLIARDDFYKGQGRQYRPAIEQQGYVLPGFAPKR